MNWNEIEGKWKQLKGDIRSRWGNLTDDDIDAVDGQREKLAGKLQERYGVSKDKAKQQIDDWVASF
jgi:uncharacterized protein YjbJ (UPF0337 family)